MQYNLEITTRDPLSHKVNISYISYKCAWDLHQNEKDKAGSVYYRHAVVEVKFV